MPFSKLTEYPVTPASIVADHGHLSIHWLQPIVSPQYHGCCSPNIFRKFSLSNPDAPWYWYIYLHDWVIFFGQILGFIFQHHVSHVTKINPATIGFSHDSPKIHQ
jgi:hypothetical protein